MGANPEPVDTAWNREPECAEIETNSDAVKFAVGERLEMQGWVRWIDLQLSEAISRQRLNVRR